MWSDRPLEFRGSLLLFPPRLRIHVCVCLTEYVYSAAQTIQWGVAPLRFLDFCSFLFNYTIRLHLISRGLSETGAVTRTLIDWSVCSFRLCPASQPYSLWMGCIGCDFFLCVFVLEVAMVTVTYSGISCCLFRVPGDACHVIKIWTDVNWRTRIFTFDRNKSRHLWFSTFTNLLPVLFPL